MRLLFPMQGATALMHVTMHAALMHVATSWKIMNINKMWYKV